MKRYIKIIIMIVGMIIFWIVFFTSAIYKRNEYIAIYNEGVELLETGNYEDAVECFRGIPDYIHYRDISDLINKYINSEEFVICPNCGHILK